MSKNDRAVKLAQALVNGIDKLVMTKNTDKAITASEALPNGVYLTCNSWTSNGKTKLYPSVLVVNNALYRKVTPITLALLRLLIVKHGNELQTVVNNADRIESLLRENPNAVLTVDVAMQALLKFDSMNNAMQDTPQE